MGKRRMRKICRPKHGPEWHIQKDVIRYLVARGWHVEHTHGNLYQTGFPDLFVAHTKWGTRWIDCKQPKKYTFTKAQKQKWPLWESFGIGIWILTAGTQAEYDKLFNLPNWRAYWKDSWGRIPTQADIDRMLDELVREGQSA
jgi:hypothetical protein